MPSGTALTDGQAHTPRQAQVRRAGRYRQASLEHRVMLARRPRVLALLAAALVGGATAPALAQGAAAETAGSVSSREADGLQIELRPSTVVSRTGDLVPYVLTVRDAAADSYRLEVIYSDGTAYETAMQVLCASDKGGSLNKTFDLSHASASGHLRPHRPRPDGRLWSRERECDGDLGCCRDPRTGNDQRWRCPNVVHRQAAERPARPTQSRNRGQPRGRRGWPQQVVVAWGDGQRTTYKNRSRCEDPIVRFPSGRFPVTVSHKYKRPGRYSIQVVGTSAGCGQADEQTVVRTFKASVTA